MPRCGASGCVAGTSTASRPTKRRRRPPGPGERSRPRSHRTRSAGSGERSLVDERASDDDTALGLAQAELDLGVAAEVVLRGVALGDPRLRPGSHGRGQQRGSGDLPGATSSPRPPHHRPGTRLPVRAVERATDPRSAPVRHGRHRRRGVGASTIPTGSAACGSSCPPSATSSRPGWRWSASARARARGSSRCPTSTTACWSCCIHGDPAYGVVLGGLYGAEGPSDSGVVGGAVKRYTLRTSGGHILQLDDENADARGSRIRPAATSRWPGRRSPVHSAVDLEIEAPGRNIKIVARLGRLRDRLMRWMHGPGSPSSASTSSAPSRTSRARRWSGSTARASWSTPTRRAAPSARARTSASRSSRAPRRSR